SALIKSGNAAFDSLAMKYSQDPGSAVKGGDLGYATPGKMVKPFNDAIFYQMNKGDLKIVPSQFGLHLIQITDARYDNNVPGIHLAVIGDAILPGENISNQLYDEAQNLVQEHRTLEALEKAIKDGGKYKLEVAGNLFMNAYEIAKFGPGSSNTGRDIVRWAYAEETQVGDVSTEVYSLQEPDQKYVNRYVIAGLHEILPEGMGSYEPFREALRAEILKKKRFEKIKEQLGQIADLQAGLGGYTYSIDTAKAISPYAGYIPNLGEEVKVISALKKLTEGQTSPALMGEKGVFVCKILKREEPKAPENLDAFRSFYVHPAKNVAMSYLMNAMRNEFKIKDNRSKFF
ncbi:MAG TPA: peptidylprolyl isomerase, partial [Saprospiraceae bacterium]|nr:peptidylprolyl isomerase [Saprospiraceae bacterium]